MFYYHFFLKLFIAILLSSCSCKLMLDFQHMLLNDYQTCMFQINIHAWEKQLGHNSGATWPSWGDWKVFFHRPTLKQQKGGSVIHLSLCWVERRVRVNDYWLASRRVGVRGLLTASLAVWLLLALLSMSCTTQVSGCPWQMLFASPVHYLWGAGWPLGLTANMQVDAYQFKLRGGPPRDQGM